MITWFKALLFNIRFYILLLSGLLALGIYGWVSLSGTLGTPQLAKLNQWYGLIALIYLYLSLIGSPLYYAFSFLPGKPVYIKSARAIGVSAFFFALLHALFSFFGQLQGFGGLGFLSNRYLLAIVLSATSLLILTILASTSFDIVMQKLTFARWKKLHKLVYIAGVLIIIHALMLGSHYSNFSKLIPQITFVALTLLLLTEALRVDNFLATLHRAVPKVGIAMFVTVIFLIWAFYFSFLNANAEGSGLSLHAAHTTTIATNQNNPTNLTRQSADNGNKVRYLAQLTHPEKITPGVPTTLSFDITFANNGEPEFLFNNTHGESLQVIIVDKNFASFQHLTLSQSRGNNHFQLPVTFPNAGFYRVYLDFQGADAQEQSFGYLLSVGLSGNDAKLEYNPTTVQDVGPYRITLQTATLKANLLNQGLQPIKFTLSDKVSGQPVSPLEPYLNSFGHLTMIDLQTADYVHMHSVSDYIPKADEKGGPSVEYLPFTGNLMVTPGAYKLFAEFKLDGKVNVIEFFVKVEA